MNRKADAAAALLIVAAAAAVYHGAASAYFFDDDFQWLVGTWAFHPAQLLDSRTSATSTVPSSTYTSPRRRRSFPDRPRGFICSTSACMSATASS